MTFRPVYVLSEAPALLMMFPSRSLVKSPPKQPPEANSPSGWNGETDCDQELLNFETRSKTSFAAPSQLPVITSAASDRTLPIQPRPIESKNLPKRPPPPKILSKPNMIVFRPP